MERLSITRWLTGRLRDWRNPAYITHPLSELLNTSILLMAHVRTGLRSSWVGGGVLDRRLLRWKGMKK
jgi:hypothetical protein